jgi:cell division septation protein DedD
MGFAKEADGGRGGPEGPPAQEFQLETKHLAFLILLVLVLCVASFLFGRWVERQSLGLGASSAGGIRRDADANVEDMGDVSKELTFFDTLKGDKSAPMPQPSADRSTAPARSASTATAAAAPPRGAGSSGPPRRSVNEGVMIQVFASKDRAAADAIRKRLRARGYTALLVSEGGSWKVRVGPYADREEAQRSAAVLHEQEKLTTWIP